MKNRLDGRVFRYAFLTTVLAFVIGAEAGTFTNPIGAGNDPWVIQWNGSYYWASSKKGSVVAVAKAAMLQDIASVPLVTVWTPPDSGMWTKNIWAPELHYLGGKWYVYVATNDGKAANHRIIVLEGLSQDPQGGYRVIGKIAAPTDRWAIDASVLTLRGRNYLIWSGWEGTTRVQQVLYIAPMSNPWTVSGERVRISVPEYDWEKRGSEGGLPPINEGPQALVRGSDVFIVYSASGSWTDYYCLGQLRLTGPDPLVASAWKKNSQPIFSPTDKVFGPGHNCFVKSPDGTEDWIVYHAAVSSGSGWNRNLRIQEFAWNTDGSPNLGIPIPEGVPLEEPSNISSGISGQVRIRKAVILPSWKYSSIEEIAQGRNMLGQLFPVQAPPQPRGFNGFSFR